MVRRMRQVNKVTTSLNGGITAAATSVIVNSAAGFPAEGDFFVLIEDEILRVTAVSGSTFTVIRGEDGTTAVSHADATTVRGGISCRGEIVGRMKDAGGLLALPYGRITRWDGSTLTKLTASDFSIINTGTIEDGNDGTIQVRIPDLAGNYTAGMIRGFTDVNDWRITAHVSSPGFLEPADYLSMYARMSPGGQMHGLSLRPNVSIQSESRTTYAAAPSAIDSYGCCGRNDLWIKLEIEWDASGSTDYMRWYHSFDGVHWWLHYDNSLLAATTVQFGLFMTNQTGTLGNMRATLMSWHEEALTF